LGEGETLRDNAGAADFIVGVAFKASV